MELIQLNSVYLILKSVSSVDKMLWNINILKKCGKLKIKECAQIIKGNDNDHKIDFMLMLYKKKYRNLVC